MVAGRSAQRRRRREAKELASRASCWEKCKAPMATEKGSRPVSADRETVTSSAANERTERKCSHSCRSMEIDVTLTCGQAYFQTGCYLRFTRLRSQQRDLVASWPSAGAREFTYQESFSPN
jgi:hypothetical protein